MGSKNDFKIRLVENNSKEVLEALKSKKKKIFHAWGLAWVSKVTPLVPVDTGRLRQSMHFRSRTNDVAVGTNVWYAHLMNSGSSGGATPVKYNDKFSNMKKEQRHKKRNKQGRAPYKFMEKSTIENRAEYEAIGKQILSE